MGLPVTVDLPFGKRLMLSLRDKAILLAKKADIRFALPATAVCSCKIIGILSIHPQNITGNEEKPPKDTTIFGFNLITNHKA